MSREDAEGGLFTGGKTAAGDTLSLPAAWARLSGEGAAGLCGKLATPPGVGLLLPGACSEPGETTCFSPFPLADCAGPSVPRSFETASDTGTASMRSALIQHKERAVAKSAAAVSTPFLLSFCRNMESRRVTERLPVVAVDCTLA